MKILHYALGFPPFRSGGLTKYCCDLMLSQIARGHEVALLWPGRMGGRFSIVEGREWHGIRSFEMRHPLPIPYDEGVRNPDIFLEARDSDECLLFINRYSPDVFHVHSSMGLPVEMIEASSSAGVRMIFTTHDYYPLCPRVTMCRDGQLCDRLRTRHSCSSCNANGLSLRSMYMLQSPIYRRLKEWPLVRYLRSGHRKKAGSSQNLADVQVESNESKYEQLLAKNIYLLNMFDIIHANSTLAAGIYRAYLPDSEIRVVPIGNAETQEMRAAIEEERVGKAVRLGYFAAPSIAKGYYLLLDSLRILWNEGYRFELHVYGSIDCSEPFVHTHPRYSYEELDSVYSSIDLAIVPSLCPETFGFQATEALCRGVPVAVSSMVGMKDILDEGMGAIFEPSQESLSEALRNCLTLDEISRMKKEIIERFSPPQLEIVESLYS